MNIWAVLSDEQMSNGYPFSLLNDEQMSNKVGVKHQPDMYTPNFFYLHGWKSSSGNPEIPNLWNQETFSFHVFNFEGVRGFFGILIYILGCPPSQ